MLATKQSTGSKKADSQSATLWSARSEMSQTRERHEPLMTTRQRHPLHSKGVIQIDRSGPSTRVAASDSESQPSQRLQHPRAHRV
jgi:hypothetical protein